MREQRSLAAVTVSADDRRARVRMLPTYEVIRESPAGTWPQVGSAVPRLLVPPLLDLRSPDACVFVDSKDSRLHHVPLDGRPPSVLDDVSWPSPVNADGTKTPRTVAGDGRAVAVGGRITTTEGRRFDIDGGSAAVRALAPTPDGFLVAREDGRDWTCERLVVTRDDVRVAWRVAWTAPEWLAPGSNARFDASYFTRIAPMLSQQQPLVLLLPAADKAAPWITRVELNGDRTPIAQDWFDEDLPATIVDDELSYFSFGKARRVVLKANAQPAAWIDGKQIASRLGGIPDTKADWVVAIEPQAQAALVRVEHLPDASTAFDLALVSRDGAGVERTRLWARESVGDWLVPLLDS